MSKPIKSWTGGTHPQPIKNVPPDEFLLILELYRQQVMQSREGWGEDPDSATRGVYWNRARYDAHATFNQQ